MIITLLLLAIFIGLFVHECYRDNREDLKNNYKANLHMVKQFKKFYDEKGLDSSECSKAIKELEEKIEKL